MTVSVLVVDDSPTMRGLLTTILNADPDIDVVGQAGSAMEARAAIKELNPDVVTLDIEMPNMNGLDFLEKIMTLRPMPVIMVSSLTHRGADATLAALEIGAFDCVGKPMPGDIRPFVDLGEKVKAAARSGRVHVRAPSLAPSMPRAIWRVPRSRSRRQWCGRCHARISGTEVRSYPRNLVGCRSEGLSGKRHLWRNEVVCS